MTGRAIHMRRIVPALLALLKTLKVKSQNYANEPPRFRQMANDRIEMLTGLRDYYAIMHNEGRYMTASFWTSIHSVSVVQISRSAISMITCHSVS